MPWAPGPVARRDRGLAGHRGRVHGVPGDHHARRHPADRGLSRAGDGRGGGHGARPRPDDPLDVAGGRQERRGGHVGGVRHSRTGGRPEAARPGTPVLAAPGRDPDRPAVVAWGGRRRRDARHRAPGRRGATIGLEQVLRGRRARRGPSTLRRSSRPPRQRVAGRRVGRGDARPQRAARRRLSTHDYNAVVKRLAKRGLARVAAVSRRSGSVSVRNWPTPGSTGGPRA